MQEHLPHKQQQNLVVILPLLGALGESEPLFLLTCPSNGHYNLLVGVDHFT